LAYCHQPVIIRDRLESLGAAISGLHFDIEPPSDHIVTHDTILLWTDNPRLITGTDLLGRLLRGILFRAEAKIS
jgi:metal transporter CNNM